MAEGTGKDHGKTKGVKKACRPWVETWIESEEQASLCTTPGCNLPLRHAGLCVTMMAQEGTVRERKPKSFSSEWGR